MKKEKLSRFVGVRFTKSEYKEIRREAKLKKLTVSGFIKACVRGSWIFK